MSCAFCDPTPDEFCARCRVIAVYGDPTDEARYRYLLAQAVTVVRAMPNRPRELEDFFYEVHGEAM